MDRIKNTLLKSEKRHEVFLGLLFLTYIISNVASPYWLTLHIDNLYSKVAILLFVLTLFYAVNPIIAMLGLFAAIEFIKRSTLGNRFGLTNQLPAEDDRTFEMMKMNQFPNTLEEEIVKNMDPLIHQGTLGEASYKPILEDDGNATLLSSI